VWRSGSSSPRTDANDAYNMAVCWLNREGYLERVKRLVFEYRITDKGRSRLENEMRRPLASFVHVRGSAA
jgi:hypothetical protein